MSLSKPLVKEVYMDYQPSVNVLKTINVLLECVPPQFLSGLDEVVLTNAGSLSRERRRRQKGPSRAACENRACLPASSEVVSEINIGPRKTKWESLMDAIR